MFADNRNLLNSNKKEVYSEDTGALGAARKGLNTLLRRVGMRVALGTTAAGIPRHEFSSQ